MKLVSYTLMARTLNEVLRTKILESPPLASSLETRTSLRSRRLELVGARKNGASVSPSRATKEGFTKFQAILVNTDKKARLRVTAKIWRARAGEQSFKFCEQIEQR